MPSVTYSNEFLTDLRITNHKILRNPMGISNKEKAGKQEISKLLICFGFNIPRV